MRQLKGEFKIEPIDTLQEQHGLRCKNGECKPSSPLTWKDVWKTINQYEYKYENVFVKEGIDEDGLAYGDWHSRFKYKFKRYWLLFKVNPRRWKSTIRAWRFEDTLAKALSDEIVKEIDAEIIKKILAVAGSNDT